MQPAPRRSTSPLLLLGLLLSACGGLQEGENPPAQETLGTDEAALCSGLSVTGLTVSGVSTYQGEMAASGNWTLSSGANAIRLEYLVDGVLKYYEERVGASGTWYFSLAGITCGTHSFQVRGYPMVIDSSGNRTTCTSNPSLSSTSYPSEACPAPPTSSITCRRISPTELQCTGASSGGSGAHTSYWQEVYGSYQMGWWSSGSTEIFYCATSTAGCGGVEPIQGNNYQAMAPLCPYETLKVQYKVVDAAGMTSNISSSGTYLCYGY